MTISLSLAISLCMVFTNVGIFLGYLTAKYKTKKECAVHRDKIYDEINSVRNCLTGGPYEFSVKLIQKERG